MPLPHQMRRASTRWEHNYKRRHFEELRSNAERRRATHEASLQALVPTFDTELLDSLSAKLIKTPPHAARTTLPHSGGGGGGGGGGGRGGGRGLGRGRGRARKGRDGSGNRRDGSGGVSNRRSQPGATQPQPQSHTSPPAASAHRAAIAAAASSTPPLCRSVSMPRGAAARPLGTVLSFWENSTRRELWEGHLKFAPMHRDKGGTPNGYVCRKVGGCW